MTDIIDNKKRCLDLDPDYKEGHDVTEKRRCSDEESGQNGSAANARAASVQRLDAALQSKEREALRLQEVAQACRRTLHFLRCGIAREYFASFAQASAGVPTPLAVAGLPPADAAHAADAADATTSSGQPDENASPRKMTQSRLHPAVLKLLGRSMNDLPNLLTRKNRRKVSEEALGDTTTPNKGVQAGNDDKFENIKTSKTPPEGVEDAKREETLPKIPRYIPPKMPEPPTICASSVRMERHRIKRRLVVGNISKWLPEDLRVDAASHKWMLYVRGPRDASDVSDIVSKVRYFLHPSYRPHDIIDVLQPFYLTRRGWGEFPVRVQVHFSLPGNRPVDIIHHLKLDRTYSGLQTLGSETIVDVWLKLEQTDQEVEVNNKKKEAGMNKEKEAPTIVDSTLSHSSSVLFSDGEHEVLIHQTSEVKVEPAEEKQDNVNNVIDEKEEEQGEEYFKSTVVKIKEEYNSENNSEENDSEYSLNYNEPEDKKSTSSSPRSIIYHIIPDHDYLGYNLIKTECTICSTLNVDIKVNSTIVEDQELLAIKTEQSEDIMHRKWVNGARDSQGRSLIISESNSADVSKRKNGTVDSMSYVQYMDEKGNLFLISLEKPAVTPNSNIAKGTQFPACVLDVPPLVSLKIADTNNFANIPRNETKPLHKKIGIVKNHQQILNIGPSGGRSLLKKSYAGQSQGLALVTGSATHPSCGPMQKLPLSHPQIDASNSNNVSLVADLIKEARQLLPRLDECSAATWVLRSLPLVDARAQPASEFARRHPFCAIDSEALHAWPLGKLLCAERFRALAAHNVLCTAGGERFNRWSVRHLLRWARQLGLSPSPSSSLDSSTPQELPPLSTPPSLQPPITLTEPTDVRDWLERMAEVTRQLSGIADVDVESDSPLVVVSKEENSVQESGLVVPMGINMEEDECESLRKIVQRLGFRLGREILCPGVLYPAAECLLFAACRSLCEDLLRLSLHHASSHCQEIASEINVNDVRDALLNRPEFDILTNAGLGVLAYTD